MENNYKNIFNHLFYAHRKYDADRILIIFANDLKEATSKATEAFGLSNIFVAPLSPTDNPQIYEV